MSESLKGAIISSNVYKLYVKVKRFGQGLSVAQTLRMGMCVSPNNKWGFNLLCSYLTLVAVSFSWPTFLRRRFAGGSEKLGDSVDFARLFLGLAFLKFVERCDSGLGLGLLMSACIGFLFFSLQPVADKRHDWRTRGLLMSDQQKYWRNKTQCRAVVLR